MERALDGAQTRLPFRDRADAGRRLAARLRPYAGPDTVVVALPRGGVAVAYEVAQALNAPLDVLVARKIGAPGRPELGVGAVAPGGVRVLDHEAVAYLGITDRQIEDTAAEEAREMERRLREYRGDKPPLQTEGKAVIVVDDGLATGVTARAAIEALRRQSPARLVLAVPVCAPETAEAMRGLVDDLVCLAQPQAFQAVGYWYEDFRQVSDAEVVGLLSRAAQTLEKGANVQKQTGATREVTVVTKEAKMAGDLALPEGARGIVVFAHGSGSSRFSPRNRYVAEVLNKAGLGTLLMDLLTRREEAVDNDTLEHRFNIPMLARRLVGAVGWLGEQPEASGLPVGLFGASTGAAAALVAAAECPDAVRAVVSRGGRPDLAGDALPNVKAPTLLIVGARDAQVVELNDQARARMSNTVETAVVPRATHLFEEPGALEEVARLATDWFTHRLAGAAVA